MKNIHRHVRSGLIGLLPMVMIPRFVQAQPAVLRLWLRADAGTGPNVAIETWFDQSGSGFNATQPTVAAQPIVLPNILNGLPAVQFSRPGVITLDWLQINADVISTPDFTISAVISDEYGEDYLRTFFSNWSSTNRDTSVFTGFVGFDQSGTDTTRVRFTDHVGGVFDGQQGVGTILDRTKFSIVTFETGFEGVRIFQDRRLIHFEPTPIPSRKFSGPYRIARQGTLSEYWRGWIAEVLVYNGALGADQRENLFDYFSAKYNVALCPGVSWQPANTSVCRGCTAALQTLESSPTSVTFRWRRNGVPLTDGTTNSGSVISGALTSTLQIQNASVDDTGAYDCVIANACGSTTTDTAALTICLADFDRNGFVTGDDSDAFTAEFVAGSESADFNLDGFVSGDDFDLFVAAFEAGC